MSERMSGWRRINCFLGNDNDVKSMYNIDLKTSHLFCYMTEVEYSNCQELIVYHVYEGITCFIVLIYFLWLFTLWR